MLVIMDYREAEGRAVAQQAHTHTHPTDKNRGGWLVERERGVRGGSCPEVWVCVCVRFSRT